MGSTTRSLWEVLSGHCGQRYQVTVDSATMGQVQKQAEQVTSSKLGSNAVSVLPPVLTSLYSGLLPKTFKIK